MFAADEIARQLRLRDMGGIVIVDFIDMEDNEHKNRLFQYMKELMESDRAKHTILPLTKFGLMQITRQRVRPVTEIDTEETCPVCHGTGKISSTLVFDEMLEKDLAFYSQDKGVKKFLLEVNPVMAAYLTKGMFNSICRRWCKKYKCSLKVVPESGFAINQYQWQNLSTREMLSSSFD